jgi:hypothetical protein
LVIFLPRILPLLEKTPETGGAEHSGSSAAAPAENTVAGQNPETVQNPVAGQNPVAVQNPVAGKNPVAGQNVATGQSTPVALEVASLKERVKALETSLDVHKKAYDDFVLAVDRKFGSLVLLQQMSDYKAASASGVYKVPEWAVPWCHKSTLNANDLEAFYKLGVGMIRPSDEDQPQELSAPLKEMLIYHLNQMKLSSLRLYRESPEHAGKLSDMVPPHDRSENAPTGLPVSSIHLNGTLQCVYFVEASGMLKLKAALYSIPRGELVHGCVKTGNDYSQVVESLAREFAGLSEELSATFAVGR